VSSVTLCFNQAESNHENEETPGNAGETCVSSVLSGASEAEGTGLESIKESSCFSGMDDSAARFAARFAPDAIELMDIINSLAAEDRTEQLADLLRIARRIAGPPKTAHDTTGPDRDKRGEPTVETS